MRLAGALAYALRAGPLPWLLGLAASVFVVLGAAEAGLFTASPAWTICSASKHVVRAAVGPATATAWLLMVAAMMPPLLALPVGHVWISVFPRRRAAALGLLALGYAAVWLVAALVLVPAILGLQRLPATTTCAGLVALALAWSASPTAQAMRNRCHRLRPIAPFGARRCVDCLLQGVESGVSCVGACWPWMLVPAAAGAYHLTAMAVLAVLLFLERLAPPEPPRWRSPPLVRITAALA